LIPVSDVPEFVPDESGYIYAQIADHIEARIAAGELASGARLPAERELAAEYGVALNTTRRAVEELRERKLVKTVMYKGTFIV
jgi:DNA-binding transcriptional regulator YhcF (GntR family)